MLRKRDLCDAVAGRIDFIVARTNEIGFFAARIGTHNLEIIGRMEARVSDSGRDYNDITDPYVEYLAILTSEHQLRVAAGHTEHLVIGGVIMMIGIDSPSPDAKPVVGDKPLLEPRGRVFTFSGLGDPRDH
ncbi:MAG: hypothetical protein V4819_24560 [Verrucomicrobiota bacterium]